MGLLITSVFAIGFIAIASENFIKINKSATALLTGVFCWVIFIFAWPDKIAVADRLMEHLADISGILFFLIGAMTIVEIIDSHDGFESIAEIINVKNKRALLWIIGAVTFFLSAVLDNLTTTIVLVSLVSRLVSDKEERMLFIGIVIIAANAGGAWSPIGDVTTTMLWIGGQVSAIGIIKKLLLPSLVCAAVPVAIMSWQLKGKTERSHERHVSTDKYERVLILLAGIAALLFVPVFKTITHLPPFMGMLFSLGIMWVITESLHKNKDNEERNAYSIAHALQRIDMQSVIFFLGILMSVAALQATGQLTLLAATLDNKIHNPDITVMLIGLLSAIIDNVPLVAGAIGMYDLSTFGMDSRFWTFLSYCAGTGGSALIIGSAAGVAAMGMAKIDFFWYLKRIAPLAIAGYLSGIAVFFLLN